MHPAILAELADARMTELHREARRARLAMSLRRTSNNEPAAWRERTGGLLISAGTALAGRAH
jgi:hypothetical protein